VWDTKRVANYDVSACWQHFIFRALDRALPILDEDEEEDDEVMRRSAHNALV